MVNSALSKSFLCQIAESPKRGKVCLHTEDIINLYPMPWDNQQGNEG